MTSSDFVRSTKSEGESFYNFAVRGFKYNLQVLPDVLMSATLLFAVLFQSPPMATFGGAMILLQYIHSGLTRFTQSYIPNMTYNPTNYATCSGRFPGATYSSAFSIVRDSIFSSNKDGWPSYYATFVGFLTGWIGTLPALYAQELTAAPEKRVSSAAGLIILTCLLILIMVHRIASGCEGFMSVALGLLIGFVIGLALVIIASVLSDRRATNILGLPLIRNKAATGQPIYVCERPENPAVSK